MGRFGSTALLSVGHEEDHRHPVPGADGDDGRGSVSYVTSVRQARCADNALESATAHEKGAFYSSGVAMLRGSSLRCLDFRSLKRVPRSSVYHLQSSLVPCVRTF